MNRLRKFFTLVNQPQIKFDDFVRIEFVIDDDFNFFVGLTFGGLGAEMFFGDGSQIFLVVKVAAHELENFFDFVLRLERFFKIHGTHSPKIFFTRIKP